MDNIIKIDLETIRDAQSFSNPDEIIQQEAMREFFYQVDQTLSNIPRFKERLDKNITYNRLRHHDTISISGSRGSGKSTFILSMFEMIRTSSKEGIKISDIQYPDINSKDIQILGILDPTLIEEKEHVFVNIVSRIKEVIDNSRKESPEKPDQGCYEDWLDCLRKFAEGLPALEGVGSDDFLRSEQWHDPIHVMEKGLKQAKASNDLEVNFHKYIQKSLHFLDKKAFILAFDDIDTKFQAGWPVLETIRKYLTSPQLITILSGDFSLYSKLVRRQQWENFGEPLLRNERKHNPLYAYKTDEAHQLIWHRDSFRHVVNQLEEQYLLKVLKPEKRMELDSLHQLSTLTENKVLKYKIEVVYSKKTGEVPLSYIVQEIFKWTHLIEVPSASLSWESFRSAPISNDLALYRDNLLREPVRTVVQFLVGFFEIAEEYTEKISGREYSRFEAFDCKDFINTIADIFGGALREHGFETAFAKYPSPETALNQLVTKLAEEGLLERGYRLKAEFDEPSLNRLMWVLGAVFIHLFRNNPGLYFDFLVKVGLSREMSLRLPTVLQQNKITLDTYLNWVGIRAGEDAMTIARMATGPMRTFVDSPNKTTPAHLGTVALRAFDTKRSKKIDDSRNQEEIRQLYDIKLSDDDFNDGLLFRLAESKDINQHVRSFITTTARTSLKKFDKYNRPKMYKAYYSNSLQELEVNITSWHRYLLNLPAEQLVDSFGDRRTFYSIHCLLAFIGRILHGEDIWSSLIKFSQLRDYPWPNWGRMEELSLQKESSLTHGGEEENGESLPALEDTKEFVDALNNWQKKFRKVAQKYPIPPHVWSKVFTRFYYSLGRIDDALGSKDRYLGFLMHRYLIVFLNSILVEEALYRGLKVGFNLKNPTESDNIFFDNIEKIWTLVGVESNAGHLYPALPFFSALYTLPFLWNFIDIEGLYNEDVGSKASNFKMSALMHINTYYIHSKDTKIENILECSYCNSAIFRNLYSLLNSVLVHSDRKIESKPDIKVRERWNLSKFNNIIRGNESKIEKELAQCKDRNEAASRFIKLYIKPRFIGGPRTKDGKPMKDLMQLIVSAGLYR